MTVRHRKKIRKQRGSRQHGHGRISGGHRKSGQRGGHGTAGRRDHHWILTIKRGEIQKRGFIRKPIQRRANWINLASLEDQIDNWVANGNATLEGDLFKINLHDQNIDKLLGSGQIRRKYSIEVNSASEKAKQKVEAKGGNLIFPSEE